MKYYPAVATHLLKSAHVDQVFKIQVMQPALNRDEAARFPVVYVTDGNWAFDTLKGIAHSLQVFASDSPPFILVGIGYPSESPDAGALLRGRDMTFPGYPEFSRSPPPAEGVLVAGHGKKDFYGAAEFQDFIEHELIPFVNETYPTVAQDRSYFGHSMGGGFGLYTLFTRPHLFTNYLISSPGLSYDGETSAGRRYTEYDFVFQDARRFVESGRVPARTFLYLSVGSEEESETQFRPWRLTSSAYRLASLLRYAEIPDFEFSFETFCGETHMSVWPMAFTHGVQIALKKG